MGSRRGIVDDAAAGAAAAAPNDAFDLSLPAAAEKGSKLFSLFNAPLSLLAAAASKDVRGSFRSETGFLPAANQA